MATDSFIFQCQQKLIDAKLAVLEIQEALDQEVKYMEGSVQERQILLWQNLADNLRHLESFSNSAANAILRSLANSILRSLKGK